LRPKIERRSDDMYPDTSDELARTQRLARRAFLAAWTTRSLHWLRSSTRARLAFPHPFDFRASLTSLLLRLLPRKRNAEIDRQQDEVMRNAGKAVHQAEEGIARIGPNVDATRAQRQLRKSTAAVAADTGQTVAAPRSQRHEPHDLEPLPAGGEEGAMEYEEALALEAAAAETEAAVRASLEPPHEPSAPAGPSGEGPPRSSGRGGPPAPPDDGMGTEANLRYQKARLAVTLEELERLRAMLAEKSAAVAEAESAVRELQQKTSLMSRSERSLQQALEKEKQASADKARQAETLERELSLLRRTADDASKREKSGTADQRSKDVRLNRALEELDRTRAQLKQLREDKDGAGHGARLEAQRLAAENTRLRKRQSELILAFKKQAKLIDVLKRQKLHVEAATLLSFTEDEFSKTLELGERYALA